MIKDDIKLAFRLMNRNKLLTIINLICLTVATSVCCTIFVLYRYETSFDKDRDPSNNIYRMFSSYSGTIVSQGRNVPTGYDQFVKDNFSSLEESTLFVTWPARTSISDQQLGQEKHFGTNDRVVFVDDSYFKVFSDYVWLEGTPEKSVSDPGNVVLTESRAHYYFGDFNLDEIIGKEVIYQDSLILTVSGIVRDPAFNTDFDFTDFISKKTIESSWLRSSISMNEWYSSMGHLFLKKRDAATESDIRRDIELLKKRSDKFTRNLGFFNDPRIEPLHAIHFNNVVGVFDHTRPIVQESTLDICASLAVILLIVACVNIVNIESARVPEHAKIVGVKKVLGTSRILIVRQFLVSTAIIGTISTCAGLFAMYPIIYLFPSFFPRNISFNMGDPALLIFIAALIVAITTMSGIYPALKSTSGTTLDALKNSSPATRMRSGSGVLRRLLIFFQYSNAQILVVIAFVIASQVSFILEKDLGFEYNNVLYFRTPYSSTQSQRNVLLQKIELDSHVRSACSESDLPLGLTFTSMILDGFNGREHVGATVNLKNVDSAYLKTFDVKILAGRGVKSSDSISEYVINDTYRKLLGFQNTSDAIGNTLNGRPIVGVVADFNAHSLHQAMEPLAISNDGRENFMISVRLNEIGNTQDLNSVTASINQAWSSVFTENMPDVKFMSQTIQALYADDIQASKLAKIISVLALIISSLGLFGLSMFTVNQRSREAGIRRIFGASQTRIMLLLSENILKVVAVSFLISVPISTYLASEWLERFAYRIQMSPWLFILAGLVSLLISSVTVGFVIFKAAKTPVINTIRT